MRLANGVAGRPADPCITSLVYRVMRLRSQFVKLPNLKFANIFKGVIRQIYPLYGMRDPNISV